MKHFHERKEMYSMELLEEILSDENLNNAIQQVVRNKGASGVDKMPTSELKNLMSSGYREVLKQEIRNRTYKPKPVKRIDIPKPNGGVRHLGIPTVIDRMVQQAIMQKLTPIYEKQFSEFSYGFRPGRSAHNAIEKALEYMNQGREWIVDIDLEKFFDTVNHDKVMRIISQSVKDGDVISLINKYLKSGIMLDEGYKESVVGTPQGGPLSPLVANVMLDKLDKELEARGLSFVRYADDLQIYVGTEKAANRVMKNVTRFIEEELKLKVNVSKSKVRKPNDGDTKYLGFGFFYDSNTYLYKAKPHKSSVARLKEKIKKITSRSNAMSMTTRYTKLRQLLRGWFNYYKIGAIKSICIKIDQYTRNRLRICIWKQWKKIKTKRKELQKLGIPKQKAWEWANSRKAYARVANSFIMKRTYTNKRFEKEGYISMETLYQNFYKTI